MACTIFPYINYKTVLVFLFLNLGLFSGFSQNTAIPDLNFEQALIDLGYDSGPLNGSVPTANISGIKNLDVTNQNISDLTGIENFTSLTVLNCENNNLTSLNTSNNLFLKQLFCNTNKLTTLEVSKNENLNILWCAYNQLTSIDVSKNKHLIALVCDNNLLKTLNTSENKTLNILVCSDNQITNLDLWNNTDLNRLECANNLLKTLAIERLAKLSFLNCKNNKITSLNTLDTNGLIHLNCAFNQLLKLDVSKHLLLKDLNCSYNSLCFLNVKNGNNNMLNAIDFSSNPDLECVVADPISAHRNEWLPASFFNFVTHAEECQNFVNVDKLNNAVVKTSYTLPVLVHGSYFTEPQGQGKAWSAGDIITTSQTLYIYANSSCNSNETTFNILVNPNDFFIPKYFTPNNDGNHDSWNVIDQAGAIKNIAIYNRYGKLLKTLYPNSSGWNGTFNGQLLNTDDYWYLITLVSGKILKGYFTLKR
ncbi:T9SS type B sorting domain-containing protein [Mariniflexile ostreae]|uniref:T9SS type B sorting domain-containing protein n=1 Tax=Mariniflexile ostreae TaxID=1520892 RepID=A0ABV5FCK9_9FLAO